MDDSLELLEEQLAQHLAWSAQQKMILKENAARLAELRAEREKGEPSTVVELANTISVVT